MKLRSGIVCSVKATLVFNLLFAAGAAVSKADGFYLDPQSAEGMSVAQAGMPTGYKDGSAAYYNPAALTLHDRYGLSLQAHYLSSSARFDNDGSTVGSESNIGDDSINGGREGLIPTVYSVVPLDNGMVGGLYVNSPFGLGTKYSDDWVGRYQNIETLMRTVNIGASIGGEVVDGLSLGIGFSAIYTDVKLRSAIDVGSIATQALGPSNALALGLSPQRSDGFADIESADWGYGWNAGLLYTFDKEQENRFGISYRAATDIEFHGGSVRYSLPAAATPLTESGAFQATSARSKITLPEMVSLGGRIALSDSVALVQQTTWTRWSRARAIDISFENPAQMPLNERLDWNDSWLYSIGFTGRLWEPVELRIGTAYETGVVPSVDRRSPRMPTSAGVWTTIGIGLVVPDTGITIDLTYARLEFLGGAAGTVGPTGDNLSGDWDSYNQAVSLAASYTW